MSLEEFKYIFFWEWFHRLWGRLIGLAFALPLIWFAVKGMVTRAMLPRLVGLFLLGGLQGFIGWFMVQSGLSVRTDDQPLPAGPASVHGADPLCPVDPGGAGPAPSGGRAPGQSADSLRRHGWAALAMVSVTVVWGAFVAGLDAGFAYNTWPLMNGDFAPPEMWTLSPAWINFLENTATVQFTPPLAGHRHGGHGAVLCLAGRAAGGCARCGQAGGPVAGAGHWRTGGAGHHHPAACVPCPWRWARRTRAGRWWSLP